MEIQGPTHAIWLRPGAKPTGFQMSSLRMDGNEVPHSQSSLLSDVLLCPDSGGQRPPPATSKLYFILLFHRLFLILCTFIFIDASPRNGKPLLSL